jgi:pimeloyl-ACP methyl ester carboxylesterase
MRSWQWAAKKSDSLRDFLNVVNLWCFSPRIYNEGIMEEWLTAAEASPHPQSVDAFCRSADALIEHDAYDRVGAISVPTLVTVGELDLCLPERFGRELADRIPGASFRVIADQGHQPFQEGPAEYNALLAEFWSSVAAA